MFRREVLNPFREHEQIRNIIDWGVRVSHVVRGPTTAAAAAAAQPRLEVGAAWQTGQMFLLRARADNDAARHAAALAAARDERDEFERACAEFELATREAEAGRDAVARAAKAREGAHATAVARLEAAHFEQLAAAAESGSADAEARLREDSQFSQHALEEELRAAQADLEVCCVVLSSFVGINCFITF